MSAEPVRTDVSIPREQLARLMPLYVLVAANGLILDCGPTLLRVAGDLSGQSLFEAFEIQRPRSVYDMKSLHEVSHTTLHLVSRDEKPTGFRAVCAPTPNGASAYLLNMSFGISVAEAVNQHNLTLGDFAGTDLAVEMLYIVEAKAASMAAMRHLISRLEDARSDAETRSVTDALTGLPNRRGFEKHILRLNELGEPFWVMAIDLDHFKSVNDRYGHTVGDAVLKEAALRLATTLRDADIVARIGGDEFLAVLKGTDRHEALVAIGERLIRRLSEPVSTGNHQCQVGASVGVARISGCGNARADSMIDRADSALYASKRAGRGKITVLDV